MAATPDDSTISELRAELDQLRAEVADLRETTAPAEAAEPTSRRQLLRLGGAAGIAGLAGVAAFASPAAAAQTDPVLQGRTNDSETAPGTILTGDPSNGTTLFLANKGPGASLNLNPGGIVGTPTTGVHTKGDIWLDSRSKPYVCILSGTGTAARWVALGFNAVPIARLADTRAGAPSAGELGQTKLGGTTGGQNPGTTAKNAEVTGKLGIPAGATAVVINVTALNLTNANQVTFLTLWAADQARPVASTLNVGPGQTVANGAIIPLSAAGQIGVYNFVGLVDVLIDVSGFFY